MEPDYIDEPINWPRTCSGIRLTTELQSFGLVVTAEPYFAVTQPSDVVVIENVVRESGFERTQGRIEAVEAKYELLKRGSVRRCRPRRMRG